MKSSMSRHFLRALWGAGLVLVGACSTHSSVYGEHARGLKQQLQAGHASADEDAGLIAAFYGNSELRAPPPKAGVTSATAHEIAGYRAMLMGDETTRWAHFLAAAADLNAPFTELYLWEALHGYSSVSKLNATIDVLLELHRTHPRGDVKAFAAQTAYPLLMRQEREAEAKALIESLGMITNFKVVGSFDNDQGKGFLTAYPPEQGVDFTGRYTGSLVEVGWRDASINHAGQVPLGDMLSPSHWSLAYLVTYVHSESEREVVMAFSTTDSLRAWVNDALVLSDENVNGGEWDNARIPVRLHAGWNKVLIKSANDNSGWSLGARFTTPEGAPVEGLLVDSQRSPSTVKAEGAVKALEGVDHHPLLTRARAVQDPVRRQVLLFRILRMLGYEKAAHQEIINLPDAAYSNPLVRFWTILSYWDNGEQGKTIDLLNASLKNEETALPAFLIKRARFYKQKSLWDRALADLNRVLELAPRSRFARFSLADLYDKRGWQIDRCRVLDDILEMEPDMRSALQGKASCLKSRGYNAESRALYLQAHRIAPGLTSLRRQLIYGHLAALNWDAAERGARELVAMQPWRPLRQVELGDILRKAGERSKARAAYEAAVSLDPDWSRPYHRLGLLAYEDERSEDAQAAWKRSLERNPTHSSLADHLEFIGPKGVDIAERFIPTDEELHTLVRTAPELTPVPGAQVIDLLDHEVTRVNADGSSKRIVTRVAVAMSKRGKDELIVASVPRRGRVKLLQAYAVSPSGERQQASSIRNGVIRYRSLEVGSAVVLQFVHYASAAAFLPNHYVGAWNFQGIHHQSKQSEWVLIVPRERTLNIASSEGVKLTRTPEGEDMVYHFSAQDVPPLIAEPYTRPYIDLVRRATVSTVEDWDEYVQWERALLKDAFREDSTLRELAATLTEGVEGTREKIDRLFHYAAQKIRYQQDYENTIAGVKPHAAPVVLERGYGDCKDKAVLMIQMAEELGIELHFAILRTTNAGRVIRETPNQQFNHAIVYVPKQAEIEEGFFLDPTTDGLEVGNLRYDDQGALSLVFNPKDDSYQFREIPYQSPRYQGNDYTMRVKVRSAKDAKAHIRYEGRGTVAAKTRRILRNKEQAKKFYERVGAQLFVAASVTDARVEHADDIWNPLEMELDLDISNSIQAKGEGYQIKLPQSFPLNAVASLNSRTTPLLLGVPDALTTTIRVEIPPGHGFTDSPQNMTLEHGCFSIKRVVKRRGRELVMETAYERRCVEVQPEDYGEFRRVVQKAAANTQDFVQFSRGVKS